MLQANEQAHKECPYQPAAPGVVVPRGNVFNPAEQRQEHSLQELEEHVWRIHLQKSCQPAHHRTQPQHEQSVPDSAGNPHVRATEERIRNVSTIELPQREQVQHGHE